MRLNWFHLSVHTTLYPSLFALLLGSSARLLPELERRVEDIESWQESKETIREEETRLSCQKEMKTELSVTERRLHGSNSFRFTVSTLIRPTFFFHLSDPVLSLARNLLISLAAHLRHVRHMKLRAKER